MTGHKESDGEEAVRNMQNMLQKRLKGIKQYNTDIRSRSKPYEALIVPVDCGVQSIVGSSQETTLEVITNNMVKTLTFHGLPPLEQGDTIRAYIFKGKKVYEKLENDPFDSWNSPFTRQGCYHQEPPSHYVARDFKEKEAAVKIEKIRKNNVVATYVSTPPSPPHICYEDIVYR